MNEMKEVNLSRYILSQALCDALCVFSPVKGRGRTGEEKGVEGRREGERERERVKVDRERHSCTL